jgi:hypothetical protein
MARPCVGASRGWSPPSRGRGSKPVVLVAAVQALLVASFWGRGSKRRQRVEHVGTAQVASFTGAWIETSSKPSFRRAAWLVASCMGAWSKHLQGPSPADVDLSPRSRGCGSKRLAEHDACNRRQVASIAEVWIETATKRDIRPCAACSLLDDGVDRNSTDNLRIKGYERLVSLDRNDDSVTSVAEVQCRLLREHGSKRIG